jgi:hypothetical protein
MKKPEDDPEFMESVEECILDLSPAELNVCALMNGHCSGATPAYAEDASASPQRFFPPLTGDADEIYQIFTDLLKKTVPVAEALLAIDCAPDF